ILGIGHTLGSEILKTSKANFRKKLSRARAQLFNFMNGRCSLIDRGNSCKCMRKTKALIEAGEVDPENLLFTKHHLENVIEAAPSKCRKADEMLQSVSENLFRKLPLHDMPDSAASLKRVLSRPDFRDIFDLTWQ
ncbi:RNA polymerase sigma factor, partial [Acidobacteriota bacterium]